MVSVHNDTVIDLDRRRFVTRSKSVDITAYGWNRNAALIRPKRGIPHDRPDVC